jgi:hypothetical protein
MSCRLSFNSAMGSLIGKGKLGAIRGRKATGPTRSAGLPTSKGSVMHAQDWIISSFDVGCGPSLCRTLGYAETGHTLPGLPPHQGVVITGARIVGRWRVSRVRPTSEWRARRDCGVRRSGPVTAQDNSRRSRFVRHRSLGGSTSGSGSSPWPRHIASDSWHLVHTQERSASRVNGNLLLPAGLSAHASRSAATPT